MSLDGEFASLRSLAAKTLANIESAPTALRKTEHTIHSLNVLLDRIETDSLSNTSILRGDGAVEHQLGVLIKLCLVSLTKLCDAIEESSKPEATNIKVEELHHELSLRYNDLNDFMKEAGISDMTSVDNEIDGSQDQERAILEAVDKILTDESNTPQETATIISKHKDDHTAVWKHMLVKLRGSGFKSSDVERHKTSIFHKIHETLHLPQHHAASNGAIQSPQVSKLQMPEAEPTQPVKAQSSTMAFKEYLQRQTAARGNYKPPAASTIYDSDDDDAVSVVSAASTLLAPIDGRHRSENYVLRTASPRPIPRTAASMTEPRSPRITVQIPDEKIVDFSSSPREQPYRAFSNPNSPMLNRPTVRNSGAPMPRPTSPRERDQRFYPVQQRPSNLRNTSSSNTDNETLAGRRSAFNPRWRWRRNNDMFLQPRNQSTDTQDNALPCAAEDGRINDVERLLREGRNIESSGSRNGPQARNFYGTTALYRAARQGYYAIVHLLLRYGAHPNPRREDGKSLVRRLADEGSDDMLRLLLEYDADPNRQGALPQAAWAGNFNVVQLLLEYGADINETEKDQTALWRAASRGHTQVVEILLREGADPQFTLTGYSPLYKAVEHGNFQCARLLLQYGARPAQTILHMAVEEGQEQIVRELLRRGALPSEYQVQIDGRRRYPLHLAARGGHLGVAKLLLDHRANPNVLTEDGRGPVDIAIEEEDDDMINLLSRAGGYPQQSVIERGPGYRVRDVDSPRGSHESQLRRFSSSLPERPHRPRRHSGLPASRSFENETKRRDRSANGSRRDNASQGSSSSKLNVGALAGLVTSGVMMLGGV